MKTLIVVVTIVVAAALFAYINKAQHRDLKDNWDRIRRKWS